VTGVVDVLMSTPPSRPGDNAYLRRLMTGTSADVRVRPLTAGAALRGRPDVFHVHWPHQLYRAATPAKARIKRVLTGLLLRRVRRLGIPVVLTVHNRRSHEEETVGERRILSRLEDLIDVRILLNEEPRDDLDDAVVVLHAHYRDDLGVLPAPAPAPDHDVLLFGLLRPYKGIERLLSAAEQSGATLTVTGAALYPDYAENLSAAARDIPGARVLIGHRDAADLTREILAHRLVCLPYPGMYNSGALLHALSAGRPVLAPRTGANEALQREVGPEWLHLYDGPLTGEILAGALAARMPEGACPLSRRDPAAGVALHEGIYRSLSEWAASGRVGSARDAVLSDPALRAHSPRNR